MASQEDLILKQFSSARQGLQQQQRAAEEKSQMGVNRQQALTGMSGGTALKAQENAQQGLANQFSQANASLESSQASALQNVQAQKEQQQYATQERLGGQEFQAGLLGKQQAYGTQERVAGQEFAGAQTEAQRRFAAEQALLGQQYGTQERLGTQGFQQGLLGQQQAYGTQERLGTQSFQQGLLGQQQAYGTQERLGGQEFAGTQAEAQRQFGAEQARLAQQYGTQERIGTQAFGAEQQKLGQEFQAGQTAKEMAAQKYQFDNTFGLQQQQFQAARDQFNSQMAYQYNEFNENQKTNFINALTALQKAGISSASDFNKYANVIASAGKNVPQLQPVLPSGDSSVLSIPRSPFDAGRDGNPNYVPVPNSGPLNPGTSAAGSSGGFVPMGTPSAPVANPTAPASQPDYRYGTDPYQRMGTPAMGGSNERQIYNPKTGQWQKFDPIHDPQSGAYNKWVCTHLFRKRLINFSQFQRLALGHLIAIFRDPNFVYWYLTTAGELVERAEADHFNWKSFPIECLDLFEEQGFAAGFKLYKQFVLELYQKYGEGLRSPSSVSFGALKLLTSRWLYRALPKFISIQRVKG